MHERACKGRGPLALCSSASQPTMNYLVYEDGESAPALFPSFLAAPGTQRWSTPVSRHLWPAHTGTPLTGPPCASRETPAAAAFAAASVPATIGMICAVSAMENASLATDIDLWRCSQKRHQQACERRSADAKRAGKEWRAGVLKVAEPSGYLRRAMELRLTGADLAFYIRELLVHSPALLNGVHDRTQKVAALEHLGLKPSETTFYFCGWDRCEGS